MHSLVYTHRCVQGKEKTKMKRKNSKKSGIIAAVVGLSAVSLVSVGFASWVMSGGDSTTIESNIEVETLDDQRFLILKTGDDQPSLTFGTNGKNYKNQTVSSIVYGINDSNSSDYTNPWLNAKDFGEQTDTNKYENLDVKLTFYVANAPTASNIRVTFAPKANVSEGPQYTKNWNDAVEEELVAAPTIGTPVVSDAGSKTIQGITGACKKVDVSIHFNWGEAFGGDNPYDYFNAQDYSVEKSNEAKTKLTALEGYLTGMVYVLTIETAEQFN